MVVWWWWWRRRIKGKIIRRARFKVYGEAKKAKKQEGLT